MEPLHQKDRVLETDETRVGESSQAQAGLKTVAQPAALTGIQSSTIVESALAAALLPSLTCSSATDDQFLPLPSSLLSMAPSLSPNLSVNNQRLPEQATAAAALSMTLGETDVNSNITTAVPLPNPTLHNLIPGHLQSLSLAPSLNGTPGYPSALIPPLQQALGNLSVPLNPSSLVHVTAGTGLAIPNTIPLTVQDRPLTPPVYNGVNPNYPGLRVLSNSPPMFCVENFLTPFECNFLVQVAQDSFGPAPVVGKGVGEVSPSRTSSTCYLAREDVPDIMRKISLLTGKPVEHCELPQVGRYFPTQQYLQHFDAFDLSTEDGCRFASNGGQRTITVLIYLNDVMRGGATRFPALNMEVQPRHGMALVFFPATVDGMLDKMALHAALPAIDTKYVSQCWIRQSTYNGQPSKRLPATLGAPFGMNEALAMQQQQSLF